MATTTRSGPPPRLTGVAKAVWTLLQPANFEAAAPKLRAHAYRRPTRGIPPRVDAYLPDGDGPHPSVIITHGGGFVIGSRDMKPVRYLATRLVEAGYAVAAYDYRMIFRGGRLREALDDTAAVAAWWRLQADGLALDPQRISLAGFSAGATLSLLHAAESEHTYDRLVSFYGVYDFSYLGGTLAGWMRRLLLRSADPEDWRKHSPLHQPISSLPLLLIHGTADTLVPIEHARRLAAHRREHGSPAELYEIPDEPHGFVNDAQLPATREAVDKAISFLG